MEFNNLVTLQFDAIDNGIRTSKLLQVFSKQAPMIDALITHFAEQMKRRRNGENGQPPENVAEGKLSTLFTVNLRELILAKTSFWSWKTKKNSLIAPNSILFAEPNPIQNNGCGVLSNKLSKLTLATFDADGRCIGQMGSLSISY